MTTKPTPAQQHILNMMQQGSVLYSMLSTKYCPFNTNPEHCGSLRDPQLHHTINTKSILISTIKSMLAKGLIVEEYRYVSSSGSWGEHESETWCIHYKTAKQAEKDDLRERRILFFAAMRQPEMRLLYKALWHLKWDKGVDISTIQSLEMERYGAYNDCWLLLTDRWLVTTLQADKPDLDDFLSFRLHDDADPLCECSDCRDALMCHLSCKGYYVALMEREQAESEVAR